MPSSKLSVKYIDNCSSQKPGEPYISTTCVNSLAIYPVSSSNSRLAASTLSSSSSNLPAGISSNGFSTGLRYCFTNKTSFLGVTAQTATAPL